VSASNEQQRQMGAPARDSVAGPVRPRVVPAHRVGGLDGAALAGLRLRSARTPCAGALEPPRGVDALLTPRLGCGTDAWSMLASIFSGSRPIALATASMPALGGALPTQGWSSSGDGDEHVLSRSVCFEFSSSHWQPDGTSTAGCVCSDLSARGLKSGGARCGEAIFPPGELNGCLRWYRVEKALGPDGGRRVCGPTMPSPTAGAVAGRTGSGRSGVGVATGMASEMPSVITVRTSACMPSNRSSMAAMADSKRLSIARNVASHVASGSPGTT